MCDKPTHGIHTCRNPIPGHKIHICYPCIDNMTWNNQGLTYREWMASQARHTESWEAQK